MRPPPVQSPPPPEPQPHPVDESDIAPVSGIPPTVGASEGIRFMMADELAEVEAEVEAATGTQPESEWVEVEAKPPAVEITETVVETEMNGHTVVEDVVTITTTTEVSAIFLYVIRRIDGPWRCPLHNSTGLTRTMASCPHLITFRRTMALRQRHLHLSSKQKAHLCKKLPALLARTARAHL